MNTKKKPKKEITQKDKDHELWIGAEEAASIISINSGHTVQADYVRLLARTKPLILRRKPKNGNVSLYYKPDVEMIKVKVRRVASKPVENNRTIEEAA